MVAAEYGNYRVRKYVQLCIAYKSMLELALGLQVIAIIKHVWTVFESCRHVNLTLAL